MALRNFIRLKPDLYLNVNRIITIKFGESWGSKWVALGWGPGNITKTYYERPNEEHDIYKNLVAYVKDIDDPFDVSMSKREMKSESISSDTNQPTVPKYKM